MTEFRHSLTEEGNSYFGFSKRPSVARWAPIPLRLIVGCGFIEHGLAKLSRGPEAFAVILQALCVPVSHLMTWITILTELVGGVAVLLGAFVSRKSTDGRTAPRGYLNRSPTVRI